MTDDNRENDNDFHDDFQIFFFLHIYFLYVIIIIIILLFALLPTTRAATFHTFHLRLNFHRSAIECTMLGLEVLFWILWIGHFMLWLSHLFQKVVISIVFLSPLNESHDLDEIWGKKMEKVTSQKVLGSWTKEKCFQRLHVHTSSNSGGAYVQAHAKSGLFFYPA